MNLLEPYISLLTQEDKNKITEISAYDTDSLIKELCSLDATLLRRIFSREKFINNLELNKKGLHILRMVLADANVERRRKKFDLYKINELEAIRKEGFLKIENFMEQEHFEDLREKVLKSVNLLPDDKFGKTSIQINNPSKFYNLNFHVLEIMKSVAGVNKFFGDVRHGYPRVDVDYILHKGGEKDIQYSLHSDIFYTTVKCWLYIEDVKDEHGPLTYIPKSHLNSYERLKWDYQTSLIACNTGDELFCKRMERNGTPGSFRICEGDSKGEADELKRNNFSTSVKITAKKNTLVIADTKGFHGRGRADRGQKRITIQMQYRIDPFLIL